VINVPVTFRDFISLPTTGNTRHPDFEIFSGSGATLGLVQSQLGAGRKPVKAAICDNAGTTGCPYGQQLTTAANFNQWYRDTAGVNMTRTMQLPFTQLAGSTYRYNNNALFPFTGLGMVAAGRENASGGNNTCTAPNPR
jgi:hypothetical protein